VERAQEYYQKAAELTLQGNHLAALESIQQGLALADRSDLHLLAALIHQKLGQFDQMRRHVAAIPVDDILRKEGEWLLRSHQEKLRQAREEAKKQAGRKQRTTERDEIYSFPGPNEQLPVRPRRGRALWLVLAAVVIALVFWRGPANMLNEGALAIRQVQQLVNPVDQSATAPVALPETTSREDESKTPDGSGAPETQAGTDIQSQETTPAVRPTLTPVPTATPPVDMVNSSSEEDVAIAPEEGPTTPEPVAAGEEGTVVVIATAESQEVDLNEYLMSLDRADLAALHVSASRVDERLTLAGVVQSTEQRNELIALARELPGVTEVDAINLLIRLPKTYTVEEGDTLWTIAVKLYGDGSRWQDIYDANRGALPNPTLLAPGTKLTVPPM
jgi:nucleoid-associated protein YgaU